VLKIAALVIQKADREHPADAVLRTELKNQRGLSRESSRDVAEAVFAYYRWLGWLDRTRPLPGQILDAVELGRRFQSDPASFSDDELLQRALPGWVADQVEISADWMRALQEEPRIWLRARAGQGSRLAERLGDCVTMGDQPMRDAIL
jgi:16S rRNA (cytosine967-C5)-methyltransferase